MKSEPEIAERIRRLRDSRGMTQVEFAEALGVDQTRVSQWELGSGSPSAAAYIKLGALAAENDIADAMFFWDNVGLYGGPVASLVAAWIRVGRAEMGPALQAAEDALKSKIAEARAGNTVAVVPHVDGGWKHQAELPPMLVDAAKVERISSTRYLIPRSEGCQSAIVFDTSGAPARSLGAFRDQVVLVSVARVPPKATATPEGLYIGTLRASGGVVTLEPPREFKYNMHRGSGVLTLASFDLRQGTDAARWKNYRGTAEPLSEQRAYQEAIREAERLYVPNVPFADGVEIMGRVIAVFFEE
jgi:transcriptional regulator with XRE-family HTH domain